MSHMPLLTRKEAVVLLLGRFRDEQDSICIFSPDYGVCHWASFSWLIRQFTFSRIYLKMDHESHIKESTGYIAF
jgi:hypothetical protein